MKKIVALSMSVLVLSLLADEVPKKPLPQNHQKLKEQQNSQLGALNSEVEKKKVKLQEEWMKKKSYPRGNIATH